MTTPAQRSRRWQDMPGAALRLLLSALLVVPVGVLTIQSWQSIEADRESAIQERDAVEYLRSLEQVLVALVDAQSAAVANQPAGREALHRAVEATASVDARLGDELRARERWAGVRAKVEALPDRDPTGPDQVPDQVFATYIEVADLVLALYGKIRDTSGLIRDPGADSFHLQDSAAEELPEAMVAAGRLADTALLSANRPASQQLRTATELTVAREALLEPVEDMVNGLQSAVNGTESGQLSGNLLRELDAYQRAVDRLAVAALGTEESPVDPAAVGAARISSQLAAVGLSAVLFEELDTLLADRIAGLANDRLRTILAAAGALLLLIGLIALDARRSAGIRSAPDHGGTDAEPPADPRGDWDLPTQWSEPVPAQIGAARTPATAGDASTSRSGEPTPGRSDVAR